VKEDYNGGLSALGFAGSRAVNRSLNVFVKNLQTKEKENASKKTGETSEAS